MEQVHLIWIWRWSSLSGIPHRSNINAIWRSRILFLKTGIRSYDWILSYQSLNFDTNWNTRLFHLSFTFTIRKERIIRKQFWQHVALTSVSLHIYGSRRLIWKHYKKWKFIMYERMREKNCKDWIKNKQFKKKSWQEQASTKMKAKKVGIV